MDAAVMWTHGSYEQALLPKLKIAQEIHRRDSLSSARTGDSGYLSDPDASLSPLETCQSPDQGELTTQWSNKNHSDADVTRSALHVGNFHT
jgi:hypothetical protein